VWDFPGQINFFETAYDSQEIFGEVGALIFVIDAQARIHFMIARRYNLRI
jgi:Ras-related GTP-binding protein C/D